MNRKTLTSSWVISVSTVSIFSLPAIESDPSCRLTFFVSYFFIIFSNFFIYFFFISLNFCFLIEIFYFIFLPLFLSYNLFHLSTPWNKKTNHVRDSNKILRRFPFHSLFILSVVAQKTQSRREYKKSNFLSLGAILKNMRMRCVHRLALSN